MKKIIENQKGFAMPLALMVMLLGMALWQYGTSETLQVARAEKNMKAYFLARSGMDITQEILQKDMEKLLGDANDFYFSGTLLNDDKKLVFSANAPEITGKDVVIKVDKDETWNSVKKTGKIIATGYSGNVSDVISCKFEYQDNSPASAYKLHWIRDNGNIANIDYIENSGPVVWSYSGSEITAVITEGDNKHSVFAAPVMEFTNDTFYEDNKNNPIGYVALRIMGNGTRLNLNADFFRFERNILFEGNKNQDAVLTLNTYANKVLTLAEIGTIIESLPEPLHTKKSLVDLAGDRLFGDQDDPLPLNNWSYGLLELNERIKIYTGNSGELYDLQYVYENEEKPGHVIGNSGNGENGYYLFPSGTFFTTNDNGNESLGRLIPISPDEAQAFKDYFELDSYKGKLIFSDYADQ